MDNTIKTTDNIINWFIFAAVLTIFAYVAVYAFSDSHDRWMFVVSYLTFGVIFSYLLIFRFPRDPFEPILPVMAMYLLAFYVRGVYLYYNRDPVFVNITVIDNLSLLGQAILYVTGGLLFFLIGYYSFIPRFFLSMIKEAKVSILDPAMIARKAKFLFYLGLPFAIIRLWGFDLMPQGAAAFTATLFMVLNYLSYIGMLTYAIFYFSPEYRHLVNREKLFFMIAALFTISVLSAYREPVIFTLFILVLVRHYTSKRLTIKTTLLYGLVIIYIISPLGMAYREAAWEESPEENTFSHIAKIPYYINKIMDKYSSYYYAGDERERPPFLQRYLLIFADQMTNRLHSADSLITIMAVIPSQMDYEHGRTIFFIPISAFIPRFLWPDKPPTGLGDYFREKFWSIGREGTGKIAISQIGELYINFGVWGILLGMAILGIIHRVVYEYFKRNMNYMTLTLYAFTLFAFMAVDRDLALVYATLIKVYIFLFLVFRYLNRKPFTQRDKIIRST